MSSNTSSDMNNKMVSKTTKKTAAATPAPAPVAAPVAAAPAKATKAAKKTEVAASNPNPAPVVAPVAAPAPVVAEVAAVEEDPAVVLQKSIDSLHEQLTSLKAAAATAASALKGIEKQVARAVKKADRKRKRRAEPVEGAVAKPNIFTKPVKVSEELLAFLGKPKGSEISRSSVTKEVIAYAKAHSLMNKQSISADAAMRKLLRLADTDALTIMNLQKFLRPHYIKAEPVAV